MHAGVQMKKPATPGVLPLRRDSAREASLADGTRSTGREGQKWGGGFSREPG
jgi:hypothetical protein